MPNILSEKAVLARLSISKWSGSIVDQEVTGDVIKRNKAKSHAGKFHKRLIELSAMEAINSTASAAVKYWRSRTSPWMDEGIRVLPTVFVMEFREEIQKFSDKYGKHADEFLSNWAQLTGEDAQALQGTMFKASEYPTLSQMRRKFAFKTTFMPFPDSEDFRCDLEEEHLVSMKETLEEAAANQIKTSLADSAVRVTKIVGHMAERLKDYKPKEKKGDKTEKGFKDSLVENVRELVAILPGLNFDSNPKLAKAIARMEKELCMANAEDLRKDPMLRKKVTKSAEEIVKSVSDFMV